MDALDFGIIAARLRDPFGSLESIGRHVKRSGAAVATRLDTMRERGVWLGMAILPGPHVFGRAARGWIMAERSTAKLIDIPDALWRVQYSDGQEAILCYPRPDDATWAARTAAALGAEPIVDTALRLTPTPPRPSVLSPLDWRVLRVIVNAPNQPLVEVAKQTGLTRKTVKTRREAMLAAGHMTPVPMLREARSPGIVLHHLIAFGPGAGKALANGYTYGWFDEPPGAAALHYAESIADIEETLASIEQAPGIDLIMSKIPVENQFAQTRVHEWIDEAMAPWNERRGKGTRNDG